MTITHEPVHTLIHRRLGTTPRPQPAPHHRPQPRAQKEEHGAGAEDPRVDIYVPRQSIRVDTTFWQHRSIFAGTQEQLNQLRREADERAAQRARAAFADHVASLRASEERSMLQAHRPAIRRLKAVVHVGLVPLLWNITTCQCGDRWPCNQIKQHLRRRLGWTTDITDHLTTLTKRLPKPATRLTRLRRVLTRWRHNTTDAPVPGSRD